MKNYTTLIMFLLTASISFSQGLIISTNMILESNTVMFVDGDIHVDEGELRLEAGSTLKLSDEKNLLVNDGGMISIAGNDTEEVLVTSAGYFTFIVNTGGTISADYTTFEKMSGSGLTIQPGAVIDPDNPLSNSTFQNGSSGSALLTINNSQYLTIEGAVFISSPGMELHNVAKTLSQGIVNFNNYDGNFAGEDFEDDEFKRVFWGANVPFEEMASGTVGSGVELCFDALDVITLENLLVENGGMVNLVAGQRILLLPSVLVQNGGKLHAWISTDGIFCNPMPLVASHDPWPEPANEQPIYSNLEASFRLFPNPTTGILNIELTGQELIGETIVQIFGMRGEMIYQASLTSATHYTLDLSGKQPGIYIARIIKGERLEVGRIIKQ